MDELKKAEQSKRTGVGQPPPVSPLPRADARDQRLSRARSTQVSLDRNRTAALVLVLSLLLVGGGSAAYYWMQPESALPLPLPVPLAAPVPPPSSTAVAPAVPRADAVMQPAVLAVPAQATTPEPSAQRAYAALMAGDERQSRREYLRVLEAEPTSLDALHGLATISLRQGQADAAEAYYLRALKVDAQDALAQAGLIGLKGQANPQQAEEHLKSLLAAAPELSFLNYALGNLYAGRNRWSEAQQAFFKAYSAEPDNPDILFNLAVSLDHLRQPQHALQFYKLALSAAESRPVGFDKQQVKTRVLALQR